MTRITLIITALAGVAGGAIAGYLLRTSGHIRNRVSAGQRARRRGLAARG